MAHAQGRCPQDNCSKIVLGWISGYSQIIGITHIL